MDDRIAENKAQEQSVSTDGSKWRFEFKAPSVGLLTMPTFVMYDNSWDWKGYLLKVFSRLADNHAKTLIIDLRGNEGGSSIGEELCAYFIDRPTRFDQYQLYTRYKKAPTDLRPYLDTWDRSFDDWSQWCEPARFIEAGRDQFHRMKRFDDADRTILQPKSPHFTGKVLVLVDSSNSSATFEFDDMIQTHHLGTLVGEPTGGNKRGINGSAFYFLHLPNSHLEVDLPLVSQFPGHPMPDEGLTPDILAQQTAAGIAAGRDEILERALHLAQNSS
jgi:C-terminal processing protease CtpA/Prc